MKTGEDFYNDLAMKLEETAQAYFDENIKPYFIKKMKKLGVVKIENVMGVDFYTLKNGKKYSDGEFAELSEAKKELVKDFSTLQHYSINTLFNWDIKI